MAGNNQIYAIFAAVAICGGALMAFTSGEADTRATVEATADSAGGGHRLLVFEMRGCGPCIRFRQEMAPAYLDSNYQNRAPLYYANIDSKSGKHYGIRATPTFVLVDGEGRDLGRMVGFPGERLYGFLDRRL